MCRCLLWLAAVLCAAQSTPPREMRGAFANLDFREGRPGDAPPGWYLGPEWFMPPHEPVYRAAIAAAPDCHASPQCATLRSLRDDPSVAVAFLYQVVDARPYRGHTLQFRAAVRIEAAPGNVACLLVRIHREDGSTSFRDDRGATPSLLPPGRRMKSMRPSPPTPATSNWASN